jgi:hypothetical protein
MFTYRSTQVHSTTVHGKRHTKTQKVHIKGKNGTKSVTVSNGTNNGARKKTMKKKLTLKEINCIKKCQYVPGLFRECTPRC